MRDRRGARPPARGEVAAAQVGLPIQSYGTKLKFSLFRDDASKNSENGKSLENLKIENTRLLR